MHHALTRASRPCSLDVSSRHDDRPDEIQWAELGAACVLFALAAACGVGFGFLGWWICKFSSATLALAGV